MCSAYKARRALEALAGCIVVYVFAGDAGAGGAFVGGGGDAVLDDVAADDIMEGDSPVCEFNIEGESAPTITVAVDLTHLSLL